MALVCTAGARSAMDFFLDAPQTVMIYADSAARMDMRDYYESGVAKAVASRLGHVTLDSVTGRTVHLRIDSLSEALLAVVPVKNDTVLALIETVHAPLPLSSIHIYNKDWSEPRKQPAMPDACDFGAGEYPEMFFVSMEYDADENIFRARNSTAGYYRGNVPPHVAAMKTELRLRYDGRKFKFLK